jgi:hypothetical protein
MQLLGYSEKWVVGMVTAAIQDLYGTKYCIPDNKTSNEAIQYTLICNAIRKNNIYIITA